MYSRIRIDILGFLNEYKGYARGELARPLVLLTDPRLFEKHQAQKTEEYLIVNELLKEMQLRYEKREPHVHRFGNTVFELSLIGIESDNNLHYPLNDQLVCLLSLMKQFCNFAYSYYDDYLAK
jgi:hypothetical protein